MVLVGLSRLKVDWQSMSDVLKNRFIEATYRVLMKIENAETLSSLIYALSSIGLKWWTLEALYPHIQAAISDSIHDFFGKYGELMTTTSFVTPAPDQVDEGSENKQRKSRNDSTIDTYNEETYTMKQREGAVNVNNNRGNLQQGITATAATDVTFPNFTFLSDVRDVVME